MRGATPHSLIRLQDVVISLKKHRDNVTFTQYSGKCACVYDACSVKNKIENKTNLNDCTNSQT